MITGHGDDGYLYSHIKANFSSNVYHQLDLSGLTHYLKEHIDVIHSYPEPAAHSLAEAIAEQEQLLGTQISVTNGATEAIYLIAQAFRNSRTTIVAPVFSEYADACMIHQHQLTHIFDLNDFRGEADLCWVCNPNNPTGEVYPNEQLLALIKQYPATCFVIDQSYLAFAPQVTLVLAEMVTYSNVILLHSMTKHFAIAGLRLGYMVAHVDLVKRVNQYRMPWSVNSLAILAGHYLLTHHQHLQLDLQRLLADTQWLKQRLAELDGLAVQASQTHFFLVKLLNGQSANSLKIYLANEHQLLIRDASNFVGLDQYYFRLASQTATENAQLVSAIKQWLTEVSL